MSELRLKGVSGSFKGISKVFERSGVREVSMVFREVSKRFPGSFNSGLRVFQDSCKSDSRKIEGC